MLDPCKQGHRCWLDWSKLASPLNHFLHFHEESSLSDMTARDLAGREVGTPGLLTTCIRKARSARERIWDSTDAPEEAIRLPFAAPPCTEPPWIDPESGDSLPGIETADPVKGFRQSRVFSWLVRPFLVDLTCNQTTPRSGKCLLLVS